jgi:hypothetical protein
MKRKLIDYDAFQKIKTESFSNTQKELEEAAPILARALELDELNLSSYGPENALFETVDGDFVHASYQIKNGHLQFDNVEELVINEETETKASKEIISQMLDSLIESNENKAEELFEEWMGLPRTKRIFNEEMKMRAVPVYETKTKDGKVVSKKIKGYRKRKWRAGAPKSHENAGTTAKRIREKKKSQKKVGAGLKKMRKMQRSRINKTISDWHIVAENVLNYVDLMENGPTIDQCQVLRNNSEVVGVRIPTAKLRNEAKLLKFNWKTMNTDVVVKRNGAKKLHENNEFVKEVAELKRANALSDSTTLEESIERVSTKFPECIYLTESELARQIKASLESVNASNYDDETCRFLSEGILRTIHENFVDRIAKITKLAGAVVNEESKDKYAEFKNIVENYYKQIDESVQLEMQAFIDVYEALRQVHELAKEENNEVVAEEASVHLDELLSIIKNESELCLDALGEAAEYLFDIVEESMPEEWKLDHPVVDASGEHPDLAKKAKKTQSPAEMQGDTPSAHHTSDGKEYDGAAAKELESDGWSNIGGDGIYPSLENPYVPSAEVPKIVGEKDVDSDSDQLAHWGDNDTWPNLQNPYVKQSVTPDSVKE